jgi:four helix bundle protein
MASMENKNQQRQKLITAIGECNESEFWLDFCKDTGHMTEEKHKAFLNRLKPLRMGLFNLKESIEKEVN